MGPQLVKVNDLGYQSSNLQDIPTKEEKKERAIKQALQNLTAEELPERFSRVSLPESLHNLTGD